MDIKLFFDNQFFIGDIGLGTHDLLMDESLETAVFISLFTDKQVTINKEIQRGWWADSYSKNDTIGSKLWLLNREKVTPSVLVRAKEYTTEALQWLVEDGLVTEFTVNIETPKKDTFIINVKLHVNGNITESFSYTLGGNNALA